MIISEKYAKLNNSYKKIKKEKVPILISLLIGFLFYGLYLNTHYSIDSYSNMNITDDLFKHHLNLGRFVSALAVYILKFFKIEPVENQFLITFLTIFFFSILSTYTYIKFSYNKNLNEKSINKILIYLGVLTIFFNSFFTDWFAWVEASILYALAITLAVVAGFEAMKKNRDKWKNYLISTAIMILALGTNQAMGTYFFIISLTLVLSNLVKDYKIKDTIKDMFLTGLVYATSAISQIILLSITKPARQDFTKVDIVLNLKKIFSFLPDFIFNTHNFLPNYFYFFVTIAVFTIFGLTLMLLPKGRRLVVSLIAFIIILIINLVIFAPHMISSDLWISPRTVVGFMAWPGVITIWIAFLLQDYNTKKHSTKKIIYVVLNLMMLTFLFTNYFYAQKIALGTQITNHIDRELATIIYKKIQKYEAENGIEVNNISFVNDGNVTWAYNDIISVFDTNVREFAVQWGRTPMFNLYTGRNFMEVPMDKDIYEECFKDKDWTNYSDDQIIIKGDTAYIAVY